MDVNAAPRRLELPAAARRTGFANEPDSDWTQARCQEALAAARASTEGPPIAGAEEIEAALAGAKAAQAEWMAAGAGGAGRDPAGLRGPAGGDALRVDRAAARGGEEGDPGSRHRDLGGDRLRALLRRDRAGAGGRADRGARDGGGDAAVELPVRDSAAAGCWRP